MLPLLRQVFLTPLPLETKALLAGSTGQPLLARSLEAASVTAALREPLRSGWSREVVQVSVPHRPKPLRVLTLQPAAPVNGRLVVISHGLWDDPESFEGWGDERRSLVDVSARL